MSFNFQTDVTEIPDVGRITWLELPDGSNTLSSTDGVRANEIQIYIYQWRSKVPKSGGAHRHVIYVPSVKNQYKRVVIGYMVIY